ncbi:MAG TPA: asparagine synthase C-terminal domain-containing protein, partial [Gammaproteobacteria bacterium]|nr:asparagine synthase C-terminal domain-containing protein [Gammaproteobacteria bacterium]
AFSQKTANHLNVRHETKIISPDSASVFQSIAAFDEPFADTSLIPTYLLSAFAKQSVTVSLSGDGGDELFGGYLTYQADRYYQFIQHLPVAFRKKLFELSMHLPTSFNKVSWDFKLKQFLRGSLFDLNHAHLSWREIFSADQKKALFHSDYHSVLAEDSKKASLRWFQDVANCHYLDQAMYVDMKTWLVDDILVKVDRASMAHSLEVRTPFLDHRLVEFAAALPLHYKIKRNNGKRILKTSQAKRLPNDISRRPKKGFNSPISHWLSHELFEMAYDMTTSTYLSRWFDKKVIEKMWVEHKKGICDNGHHLFNLFCLSVWCQHYLREW